MKTVVFVFAFFFLLTACSAPVTLPAPTSTIDIATPFNTVLPPTETPTAPAEVTADGTGGEASEVQLAPIGLVTTLEQLQEHPEQLPDGSTPEKRAEIAESLRQMIARGDIPNFGPDVPPLVVDDDVNPLTVRTAPFFNIINDSQFADVEKRSMRGVTFVDGGEGVVYGVQMVKQVGTEEPGFFWYQTTPEDIFFERESLFNLLPDVYSRPERMKTEQCTEIYGATCLPFLDPEVVAKQTEAMAEFIETGILPPEISDGKITFIMGRQGFVIKK